jgi:hypothetical protein
MNTQFATQRLLSEEPKASDVVGNILDQLDADEQLIAYFVKAVELGYLTPERAIEIFKQTTGLDEMTGSGAVGGGSTTGGGTTAGATFTPGAGEQYASTKAFKGTRKKKYQEDAPRLAGSPAKTTKQGARNLSAYSSVGFTKAPSAEQAGKQIKGVQVKQLWKEGDGSVDVSWSMIEDEVKMLGKRDLGIEPNTPDEARFLNYMKEAFKEGLIRSYNDLLHTVHGYNEPLKESRRYSQFKKEAAIRSKPQQMHEAVKMVNKKLEEIAKLLEFTQQMRQELSEGEELLEYHTNTKKLFEKVHSRVVEIYSKTKKLK